MTYQILFDDESHAYTIVYNLMNRITEYKAEISVTGLINKFHELFDPKKTAERIVEKNDPYSQYFGMTEDELINLWLEKGLTASALGTQLHENIETFYNYVIKYNEENEIRYNYQITDMEDIFENHEEVLGDKYFGNFIKFNNALPYYIIPASSELRVSNFARCINGSEIILKIIAGSIDMVYFNTKTSKVILCDWKRVKEISKINYGKYFYEPISDLGHCEYNEYMLQLNIYKILFEITTGIEVGELWLVNLLGEEFKPYAIPIYPRARDILVYEGYLV